MRTFLNLPLHDINLIYQMFAHHCFVLPYPFKTMCSYSEQGEDTASIRDDFMLKSTISNISNVFYEVYVHVH